MRLSNARPCFAAILGGLLFAFCISPPPLGAGVITLQVTAEQANIREQPSISSAVLKQVITGTVLEAESKEGEWYKVRVDLDTGGTVVGYVHESLVRVVPGGPEPAANPQAREKPPAQPPARPAVEPPSAPAKQPPAAVQSPGREEPRESPEAPRRFGHRREPEAGAAREGQGPRSSLSLWYGGRYAVVGDLNDGAKGEAAVQEAAFGIMTPASVGTIHTGGFFGIEYRQPLVSSLEAALGVEYFSLQKSTTIGVLTQPEKVNLLTTPRMSVIPVTLSLVFYPASDIYIKTGLELCIARCRYLYRLEQGLQYQEADGSAHSVGIGYVLGAGWELHLAGPVSLLAEADYRSARIGSFNGQETFSKSGEADIVTNGPLVFFREPLPNGSTAPQVFVRTAIPSTAGLTEARNAELSLSGLSLRVGLKYAF